MSLKIRIVNTAPLIFLAKLNRLEFLRQGVDLVYVPLWSCKSCVLCQMKRLR